jgi:hypothetical protein
MTRAFLAAGVAALAIATPANAGPHGHGPGPNAFNGGGGQRARGNGGQRVQQMRAPRMAAPRMAIARAQRAPRMSAPRMARPQRFAAISRPQRAERAFARQQRAGPAQTRMSVSRQLRQPQHRMAQRQQPRANRALTQNRQVHVSRVQQAQRMRPRDFGTQNRTAQNRMAQNRTVRNHMVQNRMVQNRKAQNGMAQNRMAQNRMAQNRMAQNRMAQNRMVQNRVAARGQSRVNRMSAVQNRIALRQQFRAQQQGASRSLLAQREALRPERIADAGAFRASRFAALSQSGRMRVTAPAEAVRFVGQPLRTVSNYVTLSALPASISYLYPASSGYYYQYGDGYLYQVDRSTSLIDALIPLLGGGFLPGTYLPQSYMASYVPAYYGLDSFYPADYGATCNRDAYGVVDQVDCVTGMVENVVPTYAGGYGVGQLLPSSYAYYNVPMQYRSLYYPTADYSYWYAPGAIYQYDPSTSVITSVAALMSPGFTVGQALPAGYEVYNVPDDYRATYYDTPAAWYRYNNGYIYQVDPSTMLVSAIAASLLT